MQPEPVAAPGPELGSVFKDRVERWSRPDGKQRDRFHTLWEVLHQRSVHVPQGHRGGTSAFLVDPGSHCEG